MFKLLTTIFFLLPLFQPIIQCVLVQSISYCTGNCYNCPNDPTNCPFNASLLYPSQNQNCLPYSLGQTCEKSAEGYQIVKQNFPYLNGWQNGSSFARAQTCTFFHTPSSVPPFQTIGPFTANTNITKIIRFSRDIVDAIVFKMSFTMNSQDIFKNQTKKIPPAGNIPSATDLEGPPDISEGGSVNPDVQSGQISGGTSNTISNKTNRAFVDVQVTIKQGERTQIIKLELNYPTKPRNQSKIVNTTCGIHLQYVYTKKLDKPFQNLSDKELNITIISVNKVSSGASWSLAKFQVYTGCGGLLLASGAQKCQACMRGYYPIRNNDGFFSGCGICPSTCQTCANPIRCTLCSPNTIFNQSTGRCQYNNTYTKTKQNKVIAGIKIPDLPQSTNFFKIVQIQNQQNQNKITMRSQLTSPSPYLIRFYFIYNRQFINSLKQNNVDIFNQTQGLYRTILANQFREEVAVYDKRLLNGIRYYVKKIEIDRTNIENIQKIVQVTIRSPSTSNNLYIANFEIQHYQCAPGCIQCDRINNKCVQCDRFYSNKDGLSCRNCANGFYLKRSWNNSSPYSLDKISDDICVKCHSSCKQCNGPEINQCTECFRMFRLDSISYRKQCIQCIYTAKNNINMAMQSQQCSRCLNVTSYSIVFSNTDCSICTKDRNSTIQNLILGEICEKCWISEGLANGRCVPLQSSGLVFYGSDISNGIIDEKGWSVIGTEGKLKRSNCTTDYENIWGVQNTKNQNKVTIQWQETNLPPHLGLYIVFNIFKVDISQPIVSTNGSKLSQYIYLQMDGINKNTEQSLQLLNKVQNVAFVPGSNICGLSNNQMIYTYEFDSPKHNKSNFIMKISSQGGGIYIRQVELYLGNCNQCYSNRLNYQVSYMPRYLYDNSASPGLDVYVQFSKPVRVSDSTNLTQAFTFEIDRLPNIRVSPKQFQNQIALNNRLKYFLPLNQSFMNGTLVVNANPNAKIFGINNRNKLRTSRRLLLNSPLNFLRSDRFINRFDRLPVDDLVSTTQIYWFYRFFQWFSLITMIVCIMLGIGIVFEEFSIMLQLLFLHIYISSTLQPASFRAPMVGLSRMQHLNYFADASAQSIQNQWIGSYQHPSPHLFQQYNKDILFIRSFYPTIIINLIYLGWFILLFIIYKVIRRFQFTQNPCLGILRNIPARPLNYFDQIWRYQFITTIWAAFMQFHILKNDTAWQRLNLALCFISFIISVIWPFFVVCYTYRLAGIKYTADYMYKYEDIYFKKMQTMGQNKIKYYYYIFVRFFRYFIMALFICVFTGYQIIAPIILIGVNIIQIVYVVFMNIFYNHKLGTLFKVLQNLLFIGIEIALLFVYGLSETSRQTDFINLGYALNVLYVITIFVALMRFFYYVYLKVKDYMYNLKVGAENGQTVKTPIPPTERQDVFTNNQIMT